MDRREFLRSAGIGSLALAGVPVLQGVARAAGSQTNFHFVCVSQISGTSDQVAISGDGMIGPATAVGDGAFAHFQAVGSPPFPIVGTGSWRARSLESFDVVGQYGVLVSGIAEMGIDLVTEGGVVPATLEIVCNIGPGGLGTGEPEGIFLTVDDATFEPTLGLTVFTAVNERRAG